MQETHHSVHLAGMCRMAHPKNMVRVRIAPSPTGIPHIGNTRTALFNFLFAKHNKGKFILRIEDTDQQRIVEGAKEAIIEILNWLNLTPDDIYIQSERLALYKKFTQFLLEHKFAKSDEGAVRFMVPKNIDHIEWVDAIGNKKISFKTEEIEDFIILKSDGYPTYHLASVVDDHEMNITHVIRGDEWISSTPKHLLLYKAFRWNPPIFAHLPVILGADRTKLSKRNGAKSVLDFRKEGYLKEALVNYMALLGWSPGSDKEIMPISEIINLFDLSKVNTSSPTFDIKKLDWMNGEYIRQYQISKIKDLVYEFLDKRYSKETIDKTIPFVQSRIKKLSEYLLLCEFFFKDPQKYEIDLSSKKEILQRILEILEGLKVWEGSTIGEQMQKLASNLKIKNSEFFMILRVAITGKKITPPLNESMEILGKEKVLDRIKKAMAL